MALRSVSIVAIACAVLCAASAGTAAQPESPAALRQRITELEDRVSRLEAELDRVRRERDGLLDETTRLRRELVDRETPGTPAEKPRPGAVQPEATSPARDGESLPVSALSQDPLASPDALFIAMLLEYREAFSPTASDGAVPGAEAVRAWATAISSKLEGPSAWLVRIDRVVDAPDEGGKAGLRRMLATVLDRSTAQPISRPVMIEIPRRLDGRFPDAVAKNEALHADMRVKVLAAPVVEPGRVTPGPFNFPAFIGPHAGFGYDLDIVGLKFVEADEIEAKKNRPRGPVDR